jgi:hypothetical protein
MLKSLALLALMLLVLSVQGHCQTHKEKQGPKSDQPTTAATKNAPQQPSSPCLPTEPSHNPIAEVRVVSTPAKDRYDKAAVWINGILAIIGVVGIIAAYITLSKVGRQIKVAEAATQAMIRAERAWIVISVESPAPNQFNFIATNVGRTPANVKSIWSSRIISKRGDQMEVPSDEKTGESLLDTPPCLIPPTASQIVLRCNMDDLEKQGAFGRNVIFAQGFVHLWFYGRIVYSDILQPEVSPLHETKWLYWHIPIQGAIPFPDPMRPQHNTYT